MLYENFKSTAKKLKIDFDEITKNIKHRGLKGTAREDVLKEFLKQYIPENYSISKGEITCVDQKESREQDTIIYDSNTAPKFINTENVKIVPVESVKVIIEVKSILTTEELKKSLININSVRSMNKYYFNNSLKNDYPLGYIFAYKSDITLEKQLKVIKEQLKNISINNLPTIISTLDRGCMRNPVSSNAQSDFNRTPVLIKPS